MVQCEAWAAYDSTQNVVYGYAFTYNYYYYTYVAVAANFYTPASGYYKEDLYAWSQAEVDWTLNDGDGYYSLEAVHYDYGEEVMGYSSGSLFLYHDIPYGDDTSFSGWDSYDGRGMWMQHLLTYSSWVGVAVQETDPGGDRDDSCWFDGSYYLKFEAITGGLWPVTAPNNTWGPDEVGYFEWVAEYYRDQHRAPCLDDHVISGRWSIEGVLTMPDRKRSTRFLLIPALLILYTTAGAQTLITSGRPVADAIQKLEKLYGWAITYEDTPYVYDGDIEDATARVRKDGKSARDGVPQILLPRRRTFSFNLEDVARPAKGMRSPETSARTAILAMLKSYSDSVGGAEMFALTESDGLFHVVPVQRRDKSGSLEKVVPILDTPVTLPAKQRTATELLRDICQFLTQQTGEHVFLGQPIQRQTYVTPDPGETARSVLSRLLAEQAQPLPVSWTLNYQQGYGYALNVRMVDTSR